MNSKRKAPWLDYAGNEIHEGDMLQHPDGSKFFAVFDPAYELHEDAWQADYRDEFTSRLCLQIDEKGMATVIKDQ